MNFIPEALKENCPRSVTTVWVASGLSDRMFRQSFNRKQILAFDLSPACQEIEEIIKSYGTQREQKYYFDVIVQLVYGVMKLIKFKLFIFQGDLKKFEQSTLPPIINSRKTDKSAEDGDPIDYLRIPDIDVNFSEDLVADTHLLPADYIHTVQQIKFPEVEYSFGTTSTSDLTDFLNTMTLEADSVREMLGTTAGMNVENISAPDVAANITMTPTKRQKQWNADTPSKRKRKSLRDAFNDVQTEALDDIQPSEIDAQVPAGEPEPEPVGISSLEQESAPVVLEPGPPADTSPAHESERDILQKFSELEIDPLEVPKQRRAKKNLKFWDPVISISGETIKKNQRNNIYTVNRADVQIQINLFRQTTENLFNRPATSWSKKSKKFRHLADTLLTNFQVMLTPLCSAADIDPARRASVHSAAQLSDDIAAGVITNRRKSSQTDQTRVDDHADDHQTDNTEQANTESTVDIHHPEISHPDLDSEIQDVAPESNATGATLDVAAAGLTPPEPESNEPLWSDLPKKSSQSHRESENIIDIDDIVSNDSSSSPSPSSWTLTDLKAQLEVFLAERPAVTFENLIPPENNTKSGAVACLKFLLSMASKGEITLSQEEGDEDIWITK
ncbi:uncharacterized protein LOC123258778 [Cotesia glomerata]|uniref:Uncharacterized protein n=1 Tax=Cotesia glomerata TaxID=32391 RepID=A0AAV7HZ85_COTGL|nr:uncharacterized protein LOC123258778 [Cotesia glomerata]KAH0539768.1 hypothetical protein KQX54_007944 [Cotesia glomerata]